MSICSFCFLTAGQSCKHIRDSGGSRGDEEYLIDPERSGNPLKVFCDMTTDGGMLRIVIATIMYKIAFAGTQQRVPCQVLMFATIGITSLE